MKRKQLFGTLLLLTALLALPVRGEVKSFTVTFLDNGTESDGGAIATKYLNVSGDVNTSKVTVSSTTNITLAKQGCGFKVDATSETVYFTINIPSLPVTMAETTIKSSTPITTISCLGEQAISTVWNGEDGVLLQDAARSNSIGLSGRSNIKFKVPKGYCVYFTEMTVYYLDSNNYIGYGRTVTAGNYGTICLPGAVAAGNHTPATIYRIAEKKSDGSAIVLEEVTGDMEAGIPYIFRTELPYFDCYQTAGTEATTADSDNGLIGSFDGTNVEEGMYLLSNNKVSRCGEGCSIGANRAYINLNDIKPLPATVGAKRVTIGMDGGTGVEVLARVDNAVWYDLLGNRVQQPSKGLYICNGKKVFVK